MQEMNRIKISLKKILGLTPTLCLWQNIFLIFTFEEELQYKC